MSKKTKFFCDICGNVIDPIVGLTITGNIHKLEENDTDGVGTRISINEKSSTDTHDNMPLHIHRDCLTNLLNPKSRQNVFDEKYIGTARTIGTDSGDWFNAEYTISE